MRPRNTEHPIPKTFRIILQLHKKNYPYEKKKKWLLPFVITLSIFLVTAAGVLVWWFVGRDAAPQSAPEGICRNCEAELEQGYYCDTCIDELAAEPYFPEICIKCATSALPGNSPYFDYSRYLKENKLSKEEIYFIDQNGYLYCKDCESEKLCESCDGYLDPDDDDNVCFNCVNNGLYEKYADLIVCYDCYEVIDSDDDCDICTGDEECEECGEKLPLDDEDTLCWYCADLYCDGCYEVLSKKEVSHTVDYGEYSNQYCSDCDTGNYCPDCYHVIPSYTSECYNCSYYTED